MFKSYLKMAWRSLFRDKLFAFVHVFGLTVGLALALLLLLWVQHERSIDQYHSKGDRIYQILGEHTFASDQTIMSPTSPGLLGPALKTELPEVELATRTVFAGRQKVSVDAEHEAVARLMYADSTFFSVFTVDFLAGDPVTALSSPSSIVIDENMASALFADGSALGKTVRMANGSEKLVTGIIRSRNHESSVVYDALLPYDNYLSINPWVNAAWANFGPVRTYVLLAPGASPEDFQSKLSDFVTKKQADVVVRLFTVEYAKRYLFSDFAESNASQNRIYNVRIFTVAGLLILLIACANFINISVARFNRRLKEIAVRRTVGAGYWNLFLQFMLESFLYVGLSMVLALVLCKAGMPYFNELTAKNLDIRLSDWGLVANVFLMCAFVTLMAGGYPALRAATFNIGVAPSAGQGHLRFNLRNALVIGQYGLSITLLVCAVNVSRQLDFLAKADLGLDKAGVVYFPAYSGVASQFDSFEESLLQIPGVESVTRMNQLPIRVQNTTGEIKWEGMDPAQLASFPVLRVGHGFLETFGIGLVQGSGFERDWVAPKNAVLLNETAERLLGVENIVGKSVRYMEQEYTVVGVISDFHTSSLHSAMSPLIVEFNPRGSALVMVKLGKDNVARTIQAIRTEVLSREPNQPFVSSFLDDYYASQYHSERLIQTLSRIFAIFAVLISSIGLFGLAAISAEQKVKEIGIRKVLGASVSQLVTQMAGRFSWLVVLAFVVGAPLSWLLMTRWLDGFAYHISLSVWTFALIGLATLAVAWLTVFWQCLRAALVNPVEVLKYE